MLDEVAMFIDLENLRYGLLNNYGQEPNFADLVAKAKKYGRPSMMRAYADFSEHPSELSRRLQVVGVEAINIPVKRISITKRTGVVERVKNAADMVLALDAITEALAADMSQKVKVFLLVTGDRDYIRLITLLRNKFGQRVVVCGVPGCVSSDLEDAAGGEKDHVEVKQTEPADMHQLKSALVAMVNRGPSPLAYWSVKVIDQWAQSPKQSIPGTAKEHRDGIHQLLDEGVFVRQPRSDPKRGQVIEIILDEEKARSGKYIP
jgi:uncharacterized LabA/DUF88 family protein